MDKMVFARIAWHQRYDGNYPFPYTGADWKGKDAGGIGEWENFKKVKNKFYGWVKPSSAWTANLSNVGAEPNAASIDGITVVWVAPDPKGGSKIVGWYKNAKMHSELIKRPWPLKHEYLFEAKAADCVLLEESQRNFIITKIFRSLWYAKTEEDKPLKENVLKYIEGEFFDIFDDPVETDFSSEEGKKKLRQHLVAERSTKLIRAFKNSLKKWECSVCSFDFKKTYGAVGEKFIEAHHKKPVSQLQTNEVVSINDLVAVCSNCHRMLHRKDPPYQVKKLRQIFEKQRK